MLLSSTRGTPCCEPARTGQLSHSATNRACRVFEAPFDRITQPSGTLSEIALRYGTTFAAIFGYCQLRGAYVGGKIGVKLMRLVSEWAKPQNAEEMHIHATSGIEPKRADKMLSRMGFETIGRHCDWWPERRRRQ